VGGAELAHEAVEEADFGRGPRRRRVGGRAAGRGGGRRRVGRQGGRGNEELLHHLLTRGPRRAGGGAAVGEGARVGAGHQAAEVEGPRALGGGHLEAAGGGGNRHRGVAGVDEPERHPLVLGQVGAEVGGLR